MIGDLYITLHVYHLHWTLIVDKWEIWLLEKSFIFKSPLPIWSTDLLGYVNIVYEV